MMNVLTVDFFFIFFGINVCHNWLILDRGWERPVIVFTSVINKNLCKTSSINDTIDIYDWIISIFPYLRGVISWFMNCLVSILSNKVCINGDCVD